MPDRISDILFLYHSFSLTSSINESSLSIFVDTNFKLLYDNFIKALLGKIVPIMEKGVPFMTNTIEIIQQLKEVKAQRKLSVKEIMRMVENSGGYISQTTLSRLFSSNSEEMGFRYEETIKPVANALLGIDHVEEDEVADVKAMKYIIQNKAQRIVDLEKEIAELKEKHQKKLDKEREQSRRSIDFLKEQINLKDKRMDVLLDMVVKRDAQYEDLKKLVEQNQKSIAQLVDESK